MWPLAAISEGKSLSDESLRPPQPNPELPVPDLSPEVLPTGTSRVPKVNQKAPSDQDPVKPVEPI